MNFSWSIKKAKANLAKHRISFEEAVTVFFDPLAKAVNDPDHSHDETRLILIGHSDVQRLLFVVHIYLEDDDTVRIISVRRATKKETRDFEQI